MDVPDIRVFEVVHRPLMQGIKPLLVYFADINHWYAHDIPSGTSFLLAGAMLPGPHRAYYISLFSDVHDSRYVPTSEQARTLQKGSSPPSGSNTAPCCARCRGVPDTSC